MSSWNKEEFKAYLLIYASESDHTVTEEEKDFLANKIGDNTFKMMSKEIKSDNDYQRLSKLMGHIKENNYSQSDLESLLDEMKEVYMSDGKFDVMEQAAFRFMKKILIA